MFASVVFRQEEGQSEVRQLQDISQHKPDWDVLFHFRAQLFFLFLKKNIYLCVCLWLVLVAGCSMGDIVA